MIFILYCYFLIHQNRQPHVSENPASVSQGVTSVGAPSSTGDTENSEGTNRIVGENFSSNPFGLTGFWGSTDNLQMGSFRLKNGMRINTYGEYDKDGWKVPNHSALPWEKNNFKGAFEMKSSNGAFGIRIEVQQGNRTPF